MNTEVVFLQFFIIYFFFLMFSSKNNYYTLLYFFINIILLGLLLAFFQLELFLGFFWVIEFTVVFISILLLFFLNVEGVETKVNTKFFFFFTYIIIFFFLYFFLFFYLVYDKNNEIFLFLNDNFYYSNFFFVLNDFCSLFLSFYVFNCVEFLIIALILFFTSIVLISLHYISKKKSIKKNEYYFNIFFNKIYFLNYSILRKQNYVKQSVQNPTLRIFKNKK